MIVDVVDEACNALGKGSILAKCLKEYVTGLENGAKKLLLAKDYELWELRKWKEGRLQNESRVEIHGSS